MARQDPFYVLKVEIDESVTELNQKMARWHGLTSGNPERKTLSTQVDAGIESIRWQLEEIAGAVDRAAGNLAKFKISSDELDTRRRWIKDTHKQVKGIQDSLKKAPGVTTVNSGGTPDAANDGFVSGQTERQALIIRQQDEHLDDIEQAVGRIGNMGRSIGEELDGQHRLLNDMGEEMDTTYSRMRAAQKRMTEVIRMAGGNSQKCIILVLVVVLIILVVIALS